MEYKKKIGKRRLKEINSPIVFNLLKNLLIEPNNSYGLSKKLKKNQAGIYKQLKILEKKNYIYPSNINKKNAFDTNKSRIIIDFNEYCDNRYNGKDFFEHIKLLIEHGEFETLAEVFNFLINYLDINEKFASIYSKKENDKK